MVDTLKQWDHYAEPILAALEIDVAALLLAVTAPTMVCTVSEDARYAQAEHAAKKLKSGATLVRPPKVEDRASAFLAALD